MESFILFPVSCCLSLPGCCIEIQGMYCWSYVASMKF